MIEEIKSSQPEVKASKSEQRLRSYGHLKICLVSQEFWVYMDVFDIGNKGADAYLLPRSRLLLKFLTTLDYPILHWQILQTSMKTFEQVDLWATCSPDKRKFSVISSPGAGCWEPWWLHLLIFSITVRYFYISGIHQCWSSTGITKKKKKNMNDQCYLYLNDVKFELKYTMLAAWS